MFLPNISITIFTCPAKNKYLALPQLPCRNAELAHVFSDFRSAHLIIFLSDIPIDFAFDDAADLAEWVEYF